MNFNTAAAVESVAWQMRLADYPRGLNRARIDSLFNGEPPYGEEQERQNRIVVNVNHLEATRLAHDARQQFTNAFTKPGNFFTARTDSGPVHKRQKWGTTVTREVNRIMKRCPRYFETMRSVFALNVLHGIGPSSWDDSQSWCPHALGVEDVLIPSNTLLSMKNLPFFAIFRSYTAHELWRMTHGPKVDKGWNMATVNACIKWADEETSKLLGTTWPEVWSPEKMAERVKQDSGLYASDAVSTIDCWDFYFWSDEGKHSGWKRRIVLDAFGSPGAGGEAPTRNIIGQKNQFLYNPGDRIFADSLGQIIHFQFADLSAVAPFRYHSVRSLGFMLFAVCHLQNRLRCKLSEAVFETLMMYLRVKSLEDAERALKIELITRGYVDESVQFLKQEERWNPNVQLAELGLQHNAQLINENSSSYTQSQNFSRDRVEKTKFQVMAEVNAMTTLISAALNQAYQYQVFQYEEVFRRFCQKNSRDKDVRDFRLRCLKAGVPEKLLVPEAWNLEPERVMGAGNKTMEMAIAQQLMEWRNLFDPESQRSILRQATLSVTDDPGWTDALVPEQMETATVSTKDAQLAVPTIMLGLPVRFPKGANHIQIVEAWLADMGLIVQKIEARGGVATEEELIGLQNFGQHIGQEIQLIAQDKNEKPRVKQYMADLGNLMNLVKAYGQRLQEQMAKQNGNGDGNAELMAKLEGERMKAEAKIANQRESHAAKTAQKQTSWELEQQRKQDEHALEMQKRQTELQADVATKDVETAAQIKRDNAVAENAPAKPKVEND